MDRQLEQLWQSAEAGAPLSEAELAGMPAPAQRYLKHALTLREPRASAVRLTMHGEIRLDARWAPFEAEQVIHAGRGFVWCASIRMRGLRVSGSDCYVDGAGLVRWKLFGLLPIARAAGTDVSRSAAGRTAIEHVWLPSALPRAVESWEPNDDSRCAANVRVGSELSRVELEIDPAGRLRSAAMERWGTPDGVRAPFRAERFGCVAEEERRFGTLTIPTRLRVGWYFGTPRFEAEGEFFRCVVDDARFR